MRRTRQLGWTLIELVLVIVLLSTSLLLVVPRLPDSQQWQQRHALDTFEQHWYQLRGQAMLTGCQQHLLINESGYHQGLTAACGNDTSDCSTMSHSNVKGQWPKAEQRQWLIFNASGQIDLADDATGCGLEPIAGAYALYLQPATLLIDGATGYVRWQ